MKKTLLLGLLFAPLLPAAPFNAKNIPANAQWYLHGDLEGLRQTDSGTIAISAIRKDHRKKVEEARTLLGFDLLTDLTDVTLFGDGRKNRAAMILRGAIDRSHLEEIIKNAEGYSTTSHGENLIHRWKDQGKIRFAAIHGERTIIFSEQKALVEMALEVLSGTKAGLAQSPAVAQGNPVILGVAHVHNIDLPKEEGSKIIRMAKTVEVAITEKNERLQAHLVVEAKADETAQQFKDALAGLIAIGSLADETIAGLGIQHEGSTKGKMMDMSMSISVSKALALLSQLE